MIVLFLMLALAATSMFAQDATTTATTTGVAPAVAYDWAGPIAAAVVLGLAAAFGALGQGKAISAACEGIARNPGAAGPIRLAMLIGLALIESLVIYALIIAFVLAT
jgi:F-type H+-transporting ATPase subunit c